MFSSTVSRIFLGIFILIILAIPIGAYFLSQRQEADQAATTKKTDRTVTKEPVKPASSSAAASLINKTTPSSSTNPAASPAASSGTSALTFGPTLNFKINLEGRPATYQAAKVFVGLSEGLTGGSPKYLLIFSVDVSASGEYEGLSLAGLDAGTTYTAYIKGPAQIDSSATFIMSPTISVLNSGQVVKLLTGDLNEDNVINSADYAIASSRFGSTENSANWNPNVDFNRDGVINSIDIGYIVKNFGKAGASGTISSTPGTATQSAQLTSPIGGPEEEATSSVKPLSPFGQKRGYWMWVPEI